MGAQWRIQLLGGLRATWQDREVTHFGTQKTAALLAYLAYHLDRTHPRSVLIGLLWPYDDEKGGRHSLSQSLYLLRQQMETSGTSPGTVLVADSHSLGLNPAAVTTDVQEFQAALAAADSARSAPDLMEHLRRAVALYRGELLPGHFEDWMLAEQIRLAEAYLSALTRLASVLADAGDLEGAISTARAAVLTDPLREEPHCHLMRLYAAAGRSSDALRQYQELERALRQEFDAAPSADAQELAEKIRGSGVQAHRRSGVQEGKAVQGPGLRVQGDLSGTLNPGTLNPEPVGPLEPVGGAVPLDSPYYIRRPADEQFAAAIARRDSIVLVKGPRQIGKTSLLGRGLQQARERGARVVLTDFQKLTAAQLESSDTLFFTLAEAMAEQLDLEVAPEAVWNPRRGWNVNFERYVRREVLARIEVPLVWGQDEVDRLFPHAFSSEVFGLFRSWHNERTLDPDAPWAQLTLAIAYATEAHLFISDLNQSPFNVGTRLTLEDFTQEQVAELNRRHGSPLRDPDEVARLFSLVGGHPYLVRRGLHEIVTRGLDIAAFEAQAGQDDGLFGDHLHRMRVSLSQDEALCESLRAVLRGESCPTPESFYRLRSAGVLSGTSIQDAQPRCQLYRIYLERHLLERG
jgi:DNA-binding SARP family transcriptional activator